MAKARVTCALLFLLMIASSTMNAQTSGSISLMPLPAKVQPGTGALKIDEGFSVAFAGHKEPRLEQAAERFLLQLHHETGIVIANRGPVGASKATLVVSTDRASKPVQ
ncbi:MAG TPA: hypothetical protein VII25_07765, partial [Candidatus Acidoferrum sp.]